MAIHPEIPASAFYPENLQFMLSLGVLKETDDAFQALEVFGHVISDPVIFQRVSAKRDVKPLDPEHGVFTDDSLQQVFRELTKPERISLKERLAGVRQIPVTRSTNLTH